MRRIVVLLVLIVLLQVAPTLAQQAKGGKAPEITGDWTGTWGPYRPEGSKAPKITKEMILDCNVVLKGDKAWEATFKGDAGGPYKYTIKLEGRLVGDAVLFKGTVDLGEKDGGVYDWIGRATDKEFLGFYTSSKYSGVFRLTRPKKS